MMQIAGISAALKIALPAQVAIPAEKPSSSWKTKSRKSVVNSSGSELATASMLAPRMPGPCTARRISASTHEDDVVKLGVANPAVAESAGVYQ